MSSYLALHRATLTVPVMSPPPRWALTPPFHPYLIRSDSDWDLIALAIGGLFSVVLVSDRSAWELPSALPMKSGLSSRSVAATSDHPVFSLAPEHYRVGSLHFQWLTAYICLDLLQSRQQRRRRRRLGLVNGHGFRHPLLELFDAGLMAWVRRHEL